MVSAEWNWKITKETMKMDKHKMIERIEKIFKDFFEEISKQMFEKAMNGGWYIIVEDNGFTRTDLDDIAWYLKTIKNYSISWKDYNLRKGMCISWYDKEVEINDNRTDN